MAANKEWMVFNTSELKKILNCKDKNKEKTVTSNCNVPFWEIDIVRDLQDPQGGFLVRFQAEKITWFFLEWENPPISLSYTNQSKFWMSVSGENFGFCFSLMNCLDTLLMWEINYEPD